MMQHQNFVLRCLHIMHAIGAKAITYVKLLHMVVVLYVQMPLEMIGPNPIKPVGCCLLKIICDTYDNEVTHFEDRHSLTKSETA